MKSAFGGKSKLIILAALILALCVFVFVPVKVVAREATDNLGQIDYAPRLLPTSPFYFLKGIKENFELILANTPEKKVAKRMEIANRRLVELKAVVEEKPELAEKLAGRYEQQLELLGQEVEQVAEDKREEFAEHLSEVTLKHQSILLDVYQKVPEQGKKGIENAIEKSINGYQRAIESVSEEKQVQIKEKVLERKMEVIQKMERTEERVRQEVKEGGGEGVEVLQRVREQLRESAPLKTGVEEVNVQLKQIQGQ
ncbi:hypothetical protein ISS42_00495 [Candidatus Shapirobacteria bacterium]|nr:hypothetical protein [Candidatus Shapirobacteria bacterium]